MTKKNLTTKETFSLAVQNHKKNNLQAAKKLYKEILKTNPNFEGAHNNLGNVLNELGEFQKYLVNQDKFYLQLFCFLLPKYEQDQKMFFFLKK